MTQTVFRPAQTGVMLKRRNGIWLNRFSQGLFVLLGLLVVYVLGRAFFQNPSVFVQQVLNGLQLGFIYALIALGYTMIYGIVKLINFAHGDVFMVGAFPVSMPWRRSICIAGRPGFFPVFLLG